MDFTPFGLTRTQSRVLSALASLGPTTGYALSRETGIARANVYDALDSLVKKELVAAVGSRPARFSIPGLGRTLDALSATFHRNLESLRAEIGVEIEDAPPDAPIGAPSLRQLGSERSVVAAAVNSVTRAQQEVLGVVGPWAGELFDALEEAVKRGISTRVLALGEPAPAGCRHRVVPKEELRRYWGGLPIALVVDRRGAICAVVRDDAWRGVQAEDSVLVPFIRHLVRRELASVAADRVS